MQFHAYRLRSGVLVLDLQSDLIETPARAVAPLEPGDGATRTFTRLEPVLTVNGESRILRTPRIATLPRRDVSGPPVADLSDQDWAIRSALDMLFSGF